MSDPKSWAELALAVNQLLKTVVTYLSHSAKGSQISSDPDTYYARLEEARKALNRLKDGLEKGDQPVKHFSADQLRGILNGLTGNVLALSRRVLQDRPAPELRANIMIYEADAEKKIGRLFMWLSTDTQSYESLYRPWEWEIRTSTQARTEHEGICVRAFLSESHVVKHDMKSEAQRSGEPIAGMISIPVTSRESCRNGDFGVVNLVSSKKGIIPSKLSRDQEERLRQVESICKGVNDFRYYISRLIEGVSAIDSDEGLDSIEISTEQIKILLDEAVSARASASARYSKFKVGAALLCKDGTIVRGSNFEVATYDGTTCAERTALFTASSNGHTKFTAIAVAGPDGKRTMPCGICRQILSEVSPDGQLKVVVRREDGGPEIFLLRDLLPHSFSRQDLIKNISTNRGKK